MSSAGRSFSHWNAFRTIPIVNRLLGREAEREYVEKNASALHSFTDVSPRHWAYLAVMEAANVHTANLDGAEVWTR